MKEYGYNPQKALKGRATVPLSNLSPKELEFGSSTHFLSTVDRATRHRSTRKCAASYLAAFGGGR